MLQIVTICVGCPKFETGFMKKKLITTLIVFTWTILCPSFAAVEMDYQDTTTAITSVGIERKLIINGNDDERYRVEIRPLQGYISNATGTAEIPLTKFVINNNIQDIDFIDNEFSTIFENVVFNNIPKLINAKIRDFGMVPMGTYNIGLQIQATNLDTGEIVSTMFNLQFVVPKTQNIAITGSATEFNLSTSDILRKNARVNSNTTTPITINSNCDWILILKTDSDYGDVPGKYYVRTISGTSNVIQRLQENVVLEENKEIILAKGKAPSSNETVTIQYMLEGMDGKFIPAGSYNNKVKYLITEDRS